MSFDRAYTHTHARTPMNGARLEAADEDGSAAFADAAPQAALQLAQEQENARVTLYRCMRTLLRMLDVRGYTLTHIGDAEVERGDSDASARHALEEFKSKGRVETAERGKEVIMRAEVSAAPARFSTAWACGLKAGSTLGVIAVDQGNVDTVRKILEIMKKNGFHTIILVSRHPLTAFSRKEISDSIPTWEVLQHYKYVDLQAAIVDHVMVPRHAPLNDVMAKRVTERYAAGKLHRLLLSDPMVQFLGLPLGTIVAVREVFGREQPVVTYFEVYDVY